jgi:hypothetical protein
MMHFEMMLWVGVLSLSHSKALSIGSFFRTSTRPSSVEFIFILLLLILSLKKIGFPSANIFVGSDFLVPDTGLKTKFWVGLVSSRWTRGHGPGPYFVIPTAPQLVGWRRKNTDDTQGIVCFILL